MHAGATCDAASRLRLPQFCNGKGGVTDPDYVDCGGARCSNELGACHTRCRDHRDCLEGYHCTEGACVASQELGAACDTAEACKSGNCADGVCCDDSCEGQCQYCATKGRLGRCSSILGSPLGDRTPCEDIVAACTGEGALVSAGCGASGECEATLRVACTPYVCGETGCLDRCTSDADCQAEGLVHCEGQRCVLGAYCAEGIAYDDEHPNGQDCSPGPCLEGRCAPCRTDDDCSGETSCSAVTHSCESPSKLGDFQTGCSCRSARSEGVPFGVMLLGAAWLLRARTRAQRVGE